VDSQARSPEATRHAVARAGREPADGARTGLLGGGTEGNERLTVLTGALLIVLLAVLGVTIVRIGQLIWLHLFLGLVLIGPVALKLASTGYRFMRYYTADPPYRRKGPPAPALRMLGPVLVGLTVVVWATGVALLLIGSQSSTRDTLVLVHKVSFIVWIVVTAVHVLGHLPELVRFNRISRQTRTEIGALRAQIPGFGGAADPPLGERIPGAGGRWASILVAMVLGLALASAFIPQYGTWTASGSLHHHHDHH
jgi:hypothetical protein